MRMKTTTALNMLNNLAGELHLPSIESSLANMAKDDDCMEAVCAAIMAFPAMRVAVLKAAVTVQADLRKTAALAEGEHAAKYLRTYLVNQKVYVMRRVRALCVQKGDELIITAVNPADTDGLIFELVLTATSRWRREGPLRARATKATLLELSGGTPDLIAEDVLIAPQPSKKGVLLQSEGKSFRVALVG